MGGVGEEDQPRGVVEEPRPGGRRRTHSDIRGRQDPVHPIRSARASSGHQVHRQWRACDLLGAVGTILLSTSPHERSARQLASSHGSTMFGAASSMQKKASALLEKAMSAAGSKTNASNINVN
mmetsp:Transcript_21551/g.59985  ORF Transcript_21551/g.59985 Transcript_21551/m.59985 type:complete len:123 (+) Transcript_21551:351-719(+)